MPPRGRRGKLGNVATHAATGVATCDSRVTAGPRRTPEVSLAAGVREREFVKLERQHWISLATAMVGILAAVVATPLLFPAQAPGATTSASRAASRQASVDKPAAASAEDHALAQLGIAITGIVVTGGLALWVIRKARNMPFGARRRDRRKSMEVLEMLNLGNKKSVAVARVYDRVLILGIAEQNVTLLSEMKEEEAGITHEDLDATNPPNIKVTDLAPFRSLLKNFAPGTTRAAAPAPTPAAAPALRHREPARGIHVTVGADDDVEELL